MAVSSDAAKRSSQEMPSPDEFSLRASRSPSDASAGTGIDRLPRSRRGGYGAPLAICMVPTQAANRA